MEEFLKYFEDERFVRWILDPNEELTAYWENYFSRHPEEVADAQKARLLLTQFVSSEEEIPACLITDIFSGILNRIRNKNVKTRRRRIIYSFIRYAAIVIFSISLGGILVFKYFSIQNLAVYQGIEDLPQQDEARLILSDGKVISLTQKESTVEYNSAGQIIINRRDTIHKQSSALADEMNHLIMPYGKSTSILLPDGTRAYLNAGSRLVYPNVFKGRTREVLLMGEGYFEVAENARMPFVVRTNAINVVATGTKFNLSAYSSDKYIETVLLEGKVLLNENTMKFLKRDMELSPGQAVVFNRETLEATYRQVDPAEYVTWFLGYLNFQSADLNRVVLQLERYYNIRIYLDNPILGIRRITGKLELRDELQSVLQVLASTARAELFYINEQTYGLK